MGRKANKGATPKDIADKWKARIAELKTSPPLKTAAEAGRMRWEAYCQETTPEERSEAMRKLAKKGPQKGSAAAKKRTKLAWKTKWKQAAQSQENFS